MSSAREEKWRVRAEAVARRERLFTMATIRRLIDNGFVYLDQPREGPDTGFLVLRNAPFGSKEGETKYFPVHSTGAEERRRSVTQTSTAKGR